MKRPEIRQPSPAIDSEARHRADMFMKLNAARRQFEVPLELTQVLDPETAEVHHMTGLAFDIRLPGTAPARLALDSDVTISRDFAYSPNPIRKISATLWDTLMSEVVVKAYRFNPEGVIVDEPSQEPIGEEHANEMCNRILFGNAIDLHPRRAAADLPNIGDFL